MKFLANADSFALAKILFFCIYENWHEKYGIQMEAWAPFGEGRDD